MEKYGWSQRDVDDISLDDFTFEYIDNDDKTKKYEYPKEIGT